MRARGHADDGGVEGERSGGADEGGIAEGEDPAVRGDQPVAAAGCRTGQSDHRRVESQPARGSVEDRVAEGEDSAVRGDQPVAAAGRRGRHVDDRGVEPLATHRSIKCGVTVGEDPAVRGDQPVAAAGRGPDDVSDGSSQRLSRHGALIRRHAVAGHRTVRSSHPVPSATGYRGDPDRGTRRCRRCSPRNRWDRVGIRVRTTGGRRLPVRPHLLARAVHGHASLESGYRWSRCYRVPGDGVLRGLAPLGRPQVPIGESEDLDRPGLTT